MPQGSSPPLAQQAYVSLLCTADRARNVLEEVFKPYGITGQQYNVLRILRGARPKGLPTLTIAERMIERAPGITRMIDRLERKGLVERERGTRDRRQVHCHVTAAGLKLLVRLDSPVEKRNRSVFAALAPSELKKLLDLLTRIQESSERGEPRETSLS